MLKLRYILLVIFLQIGYWSSYAQQDSVKEPKKIEDTKLYKNISNYSERNRLGKLIKKTILDPLTTPKKTQNIVISSGNKYGYCANKIIRNIHITTYDPFGYNELDTINNQEGFGYKLGNALHNKTQNFTIRNLLLIKKNKPLDTLMLLETKRMLRSQRFIRKVQVTPKLVSSNSDSVDVYVKVLDTWSLVPDFSTTPTTSKFRLAERNFMGTGHELGATYKKSIFYNESAFSANYTFPNLFHTFIKTELNYDVEVGGSYKKFINVERVFFSPFTQWAGGVYFDKQLRSVYNYEHNLTQLPTNLSSSTIDSWLGHSIKISNLFTTKKINSNFISSIRFKETNYSSVLAEPLDPLRYFSDEKLYLLSMGISIRKYTEDINVLNFNTVEDIASGFVYNLTGGYELKNNLWNNYLGNRIAYGKYFKSGYFGGDIEYGSFFYQGIQERSTFKTSVTYFTRLLGNGRWKFRQFIKPQLVVGNDRLNTPYDRLNLNGENGIQGFNSNNLIGTKKIRLAMQTQGYSPWNVYGFRMNPYLGYTLGILGNEKQGFIHNKLYQHIGIGLIVTNDYLAFSSFQFSFSFYPDTPFDSNEVFKTNTFKSTDFGLPSYEIGKPSLVPYN
jgi:hypothetical protein